MIIITVSAIIINGYLYFGGDFLKFLLDTAYKKRILDIAAVLFAFGFLIRLIAAIGYINEYDTLWYREWALALPDGLFDVYARAEEISLDYPPVLLFFLYLTGLAYRTVGPEWHILTDMVFMKFWPVVFDVLCGLALFVVFKKYSYKTALVAAALWLFNPVTIFNSSFWGQTDGMMCLMLLISFYALEREKPLLACLLFALAGMTKYQALFFTPIFLMELFLRNNPKTFLKGIGVAALTVVGMFLPFMIGAKDPFLFFQVYLGGQGKYQLCSLNAFNFYGMLGLNWVDDSIHILGPITYNTVSLGFTVLIILGLLISYFFIKNRNMWVLSFVFMNSLFMFMSRMHERYQFVVLIFILYAAVKEKHRGLFWCFALTSITTLFNHILPMFHWNTSDWFIDYYYGQMLVVLSAINFVVYILTTYISIKFLMTEPCSDKKEGGE